jgi:hypothetical protein
MRPDELQEPAIILIDVVFRPRSDRNVDLTFAPEIDAVDR